MSRRLHVVVVSRWFPSEDSPSAGVFVRDEVTALTVHCTVTTLVPRRARVLEVARFLLDRRPLAGVETIPVPDWPALGSFARWVVYDRSLGRLGERADIVHLHELLPDGLPLLLAARRRKLPLVVTEHANFLPDLLRSPRARVQLRLVLRGAGAVYTASTRLAAELRALDPALEPIVAGVAVDTDEFRPGATRQGSFALAVALVLGEAKGTDVLLRAWAQARTRTELPSLVLVGDGPERERFTGLARDLGIADACSFVGTRNHAEVAALMRDASFLVSASRDENFAGVVAESIASGTPVVSTRVGEPAVYVTPDVGLLVEPGDVEDLAAALVEMGTRARSYDPDVLHESIASRYGYEAHVELLLERYDGLTGRRS